MSCGSGAGLRGQNNKASLLVETPFRFESVLILEPFYCLLIHVWPMSHSSQWRVSIMIENTGRPDVCEQSIVPTALIGQHI